MKHLMALIVGAILVGCGTTSTTTSSSGKTETTVKIPRGSDIVKVDSEGATYLNGKQLSVYSLSDNLKKKIVVIDAHQYTPAAKIATIMNECTEAGITDVKLLSDMVKAKEREEAMKRMEARRKEIEEKERKVREAKAKAEAEKAKAEAEKAKAEAEKK